MKHETKHGEKAEDIAEGNARMDDMSESSLISIGTELRELTSAFKHFQDVEFKEFKEEVAPIIQAYDSVIFGKKFIVGLSSIVGSLAALGATVIYIFNHLIHHA